MKTTKYNYIKVIQQNYGQGWEDVSEYETNSQGTPKELHKPTKYGIIHKGKQSLLLYDLKEYRLTGYATRVIQRKKLNENSAKEN